MAARRIRGGDSCAAIKCTNSRLKCPGLSFFKFPKDPDRCKKWIVNVRRADLDTKPVEYCHKNLSICAYHFEDTQFMNVNERNKLIHTAIPTIFNISNLPKPVSAKRKLTNRTDPSAKKIRKASCTSLSTEANSCETISNAAKLVTHTPVFKSQTKYRSKIYRLKRKYENLEKKMKKDNMTVNSLICKMKDFLPSTQHLFFSTQLKLASQGRKWKKWTWCEKQLGLSLYYASPKAYRILKQLFSLPSVRCLQRCLEGMELKPGLNEAILEALKAKFEGLSEAKRLCCLVIDEMSIKCGLTYNSKEDIVEGFEDSGLNRRFNFIANHGSVLLVKGLILDWKQAIGFALSCDSVPASTQADIIKEAIVRLSSIGLIVKAVICDQGSNNRGMFTELGVNQEKPYFLAPNGEKVFGIFDPPHLLKSIRNNLMNHDFMDNGFLVSWKYIRQFYEYDSTLPVRVAWKLGENHFKVNSFSKMRVNLAAQVLSRTVAAGMSVLIQCGKLPPEAVHTTNFVLKMDQLFDIVNSRQRFDNNQFRCAISNDSNHIKYLKEALVWIKAWKVPSCKKLLPSITGWLVTIQAVIELWDDIKNKYNVEFLMTSRLNQDSLENLFSVLRKKGGWADHPTPEQFRSHLKAVMVNSLMTANNNGNCQVDINKFIISLCELKKRSAQDPVVPQNTALISTCTIEDQSKIFDLPQENIMSYVAGYMARIVLKTHDCNRCKSQLISTSTQIEKSSQILTMFKAYSFNGNVFGGLLVPTDNYLLSILAAEKQFLSVFDNIMHEPNLKVKIEDAIISGTCFQNLDVCSKTKTALLKFFVRCRIYWGLRFLNRTITAPNMSSRKNRKLIRIQHL